MMRTVVSVLIVAASVVAAGCQHPTDPSDVITFDKAVDATVSPNPIIADTNTGGRTYRVVRGNNQPDDILAYDWHAVFSTTLTFNNDAGSDDLDITWPLKLNAATVVVKQASGGIVTAPTGSETEKYEFVILSGGNQASGIGATMSTSFELWYDLPSLRKEAVVSITYGFTDADGRSFTKTEDFTVAP